MRKDEANHFFTVADEAYRVPLAVLLRSILESQPAESLPTIHAFTHRMSPASMRRIERSVPGLTIEWTDLGASLAGPALPTGGHLSPAAYGRLFAADRLAEIARRAIYLDVDMLVCSDLASLWTVSLEGRPVAAVPAPANPQVSCPSGGMSKIWRRLGLDPRTPYLQSGLLVVDLDAWKGRSITARVVEACAKYGEAFTTADQDALNCVLAGDFHPLPLRWNQTNMLRGPSSWAYSFFPIDEVDEALARPAVIHFSGPDKPWLAGPGRSDEDARWWDTLSRTSFADLRPPWIGHGLRTFRRKLADRLRR